MTKAFLIDLSHCSGCYNCQIVCKDEHCGADWKSYAAPQPLTGQYWMRVDENVRGQVPWVRVSYTPTLCAHCVDAPCAAVCVSGAFERRQDGLVLINPNICDGCRSCLGACPTGSLYFNDELNIAQKCTGCAHLLDNGWEVPRCVDVCPHEAIQFKEKEEFGTLLSEAECLESLNGLGPRAYYLHLPRRFVAGTAVDFAADEVVIGARVDIVGAQGFTARRETDELGDFKFDQIPPDVYTVTIFATGYKVFETTADLREEDLSLGDLSLER